jgi:hypothetical protein
MKYRMLIKPFENCELLESKQEARKYIAEKPMGYSSTMIFQCWQNNLHVLINEGIIEEIQEPVWTDADMIEMCFWARSCQYTPENTLFHFKEFKKEKGL